jgi:hypothetical protein
MSLFFYFTCLLYLSFQNNVQWRKEGVKTKMWQIQGKCEYSLVYSSQSLLNVIMDFFLQRGMDSEFFSVQCFSGYYQYCLYFSSSNKTRYVSWTIWNDRNELIIVNSKFKSMVTDKVYNIQLTKKFFSYKNVPNSTRGHTYTKILGSFLKFLIVIFDYLANLHMLCLYFRKMVVRIWIKLPRELRYEFNTKWIRTKITKIIQEIKY